MKYVLSIFFTWFFAGNVFSQPVPGKVENIPSLITFGPQAPPQCGDPYHRQEIFLIIPKKYNGLFYVRIFDPETGGEKDEVHGKNENATRFSVIGGMSAAELGYERLQDILFFKSFRSGQKYDGKWYSMGPFNPSSGYFTERFDAYIFKVVAEGLAGDDGNRYTFFLSTAPDKNLPVEGADAYYNALTFSLWDDTVNVSHVYPFLDMKEDTFRIDILHNGFEGKVIMVTVQRMNYFLKIAAPAQWAVNLIHLIPKEKNTSADIQFIRKDISGNRNITVRLYRGKDRPYVDREYFEGMSLSPDR